MTMNSRFGRRDARGALIRGRGLSWKAQRQATARGVVAVAGGPRSAAAPVGCVEVINGGGPQVRAIDKHVNCHGQKVRRDLGCDYNEP